MNFLSLTYSGRANMWKGGKSGRKLIVGAGVLKSLFKPRNVGVYGMEMRRCKSK